MSQWGIWYRPGGSNQNNEVNHYVFTVSYERNFVFNDNKITIFSKEKEKCCDLFLITIYKQIYFNSV